MSFFNSKFNTSTENSACIKELDRKGKLKKEITYDTLYSNADGLAKEMIRLGLNGRRIMLGMSNGIDFIEVITACLIAKVTPVPVSIPRSISQSSRLKCVVEDSGVEILLVNSSHSLTALSAAFQGLIITVEQLQSKCLEPVKFTQPHTSYVAFIQYTSGSTGDPKGVIVSYESLENNVDLIAHSLGVRADDVFVTWLPMFHDMGLVGFVYLCLRYKTNLVCMEPFAFVQKPLRWLKAISDFKATISAGPNYAYDAIISRTEDAELLDIDLSSWRVALNGSEPISLATLEKVESKLKVCGFKSTAIYPCYGMAEATLMVTGAEPMKGYATTEIAGGRKVVSSGRIKQAVPLKIVNESGVEHKEPGIVGEIVISGTGVFSGYLAEHHNRQDNWLMIDSTNYYRTGDLGFVENGDLYVMGRKKHMLIIRGRNIYPSDIEMELTQWIDNKKSNSIVAVGVQGSSGERLVVLVEMKKPVIDKKYADAVKSELCSKLIESFQITPEIVLCKPNTLLKTSSGKLMRDACRDLYLNNKLNPITCELQESSHE
jgi:acyl-CoA synthetase (AMP-forming)/AMP-acid ligase II